MPSWTQRGEFGSYGNNPRRHNGDTDRSGPGYILKKSMIGLTTVLYKGNARMKLTTILRFLSEQLEKAVVLF